MSKPTLRPKRMGDFYEFFGDEAAVVSVALGLVVTSRTIGGKKVPMCGVPMHAANEWFSKLIDLGFRVVEAAA